MQGERLAGGLWCHEVLAVLSDYLDGELSVEQRRQIEDHLRECDTCERFGGRFADSIRLIRQSLEPADPLNPDISRRLRAALTRKD